ncbi:hypothetical protein JB92DRAFT_3125379 [Gautieria morchelliformis]|nr:hypothetical protein JB92DRAFT_3125379 [Gautieria morchelliformis]
MSRDDTIKLTIKSLLEVVQTGAKNIEISVMESYGKVTNLDLSQIEGIVQEIEREKEQEAERKRTRLAATAAGQAAMVTGAQESAGSGEAAPGSGSVCQRSARAAQPRAPPAVCATLPAPALRSVLERASGAAASGLGRSAQALKAALRWQIAAQPAALRTPPPPSSPLLSAHY